MVNQDEDVVMVAARNASRIDLQSKKKLSEYLATTTSKSDNSCCAIRLIRCMPHSSTESGSFALGLAEMIKKMNKELTHCFLA